MEPKKKDFLDYALPCLGLIAVMIIALKFAMAYEVVHVDGKDVDLFSLFSEFSNQVSSNPTGINFVSSTPKFIGIGLFINLMIIGYLYSERKKFIHGKEYGTAEWGKPEQIKHLLSINIKKKELKKNKNDLDGKKEIEEKYNSADIIFTKTEKICMYNYELNNNTILLGGSGTGKTRGYVLPNILQCTKGKYSPSLVLTDPKGEILEKIGKYLKNQGYEIRVLNLKDQNNSYCFNPFKYILEHKYEESISKLVSSIMDSNADKKVSSTQDPFWDDMAKILLKSIFYAVYEGFPDEEQNMNTVMEMFRWFEVSDNDNRYKNPTKLDSFFKLFGENKYILDTYGDVNTNPALRNWEDFRSKCKGKTAQSVTATALAKLSPFDEEQIRRIFSKDELELNLVGERKTALFIVLPPTSKTYNFIANVVYTQLFDQLEYCATVKYNQKLPVPVRMICDEFYNTGRISNFENILSYARSFGIGISIILQSLDQLKEMYEKSYGVIIDNCSTLLYLGGIRHIDTLKYVSELLGKGTYDKKTYGRSRGRQSSSSTNFDKFGRELLDPSEVQRISKKKCLLFINGYQPYYSDKYDYTKHPNYKYTSDFDSKNSFLFEYKDVVKEHNESNQNLNPINIEETAPIIMDFDGENAVATMHTKLHGIALEQGEEVQLDEDWQNEMALVEEIYRAEQVQQVQNDDFIHNLVDDDSTIIEQLKEVEEFTDSIDNEISESGYLERLEKLQMVTE